MKAIVPRLSWRYIHTELQLSSYIHRLLRNISILGLSLIFTPGLSRSGRGGQVVRKFRVANTFPDDIASEWLGLQRRAAPISKAHATGNPEPSARGRKSARERRNKRSKIRNFRIFVFSSNFGPSVRGSRLEFFGSVDGCGGRCPWAFQNGQKRLCRPSGSGKMGVGKFRKNRKNRKFQGSTPFGNFVQKFV